RGAHTSMPNRVQAAVALRHDRLATAIRRRLTPGYRSTHGLEAPSLLRRRGRGASFRPSCRTAAHRGTVTLAANQGARDEPRHAAVCPRSPTCRIDPGREDGAARRTP